MKMAIKNKDQGRVRWREGKEVFMEVYNYRNGVMKGGRLGREMVNKRRCLLCDGQKRREGRIMGVEKGEVYEGNGTQKKG